MTYILRQSASTKFMMGPFLDLTAGTTMEALGIAATEVWVSKNGADYVNKNEGTAPLHKVSGMYLMNFDATDTNTVGTLSVLIDDTANVAIPVAGEYQVIETTAYDALYVNNATAFSSTGEVSLLSATQTTLDAIYATAVTNAAGTDIAADIIALKAETASILLDSNELQTDWKNGGRLDLLVDRLITEMDTARTEPAQGNLDHAWKIGQKIDFLLKLLANKRDQTSILQRVYNSDETTVDHKAVVSSDGTTLTFGEMKTGP